MTQENTPTPVTFPLTLPGLQAAYASGANPADVIDAILVRLAEVDDPAIFLHLADRDTLIDAVRGIGPYDPAKPLWGMPFAVKDNIDVAGMPTTAACPAFAYTATRDAFVVARLRAEGAVPIGKTNLDQFATGLVGVRSPYGVPRNALDPDIVPGGSSSGSAVAVAHGLVPFALGTDTAGSGRVPAALNGIVGLKPTLGTLSAQGMVPACRTLDTISVFARSVEDAYTVFRAAAAFDADDAYSRRIAVPPLPEPLPAPRIAAPDAQSLEVFGDAVQADDFEAHLARLATSGARIERVDFTPFYDVAQMLYEGAWVAERYAAIEPYVAMQPESLHPVTRQIIGKAEGLTAVDAFRGLYRLEELRRTVEPILGAADMLCVPTIPTFYSLSDLQADPVTPNSNLGTYTNFVNLLDLCALAVPTGPRSDGRPGSVTLLARAGCDGMVATESARLTGRGAASRGVGATARVGAGATAAATAGAGAGEVTIAVCGAHMSGLPLNPDLTDRGARFVRHARTAAGYRLFVLPGGPPVRPGLVRQGDGSGGRIDVELWALPSGAVGSFIRTVPSPLSIGSIQLDDGEVSLGFLCEHAAISGASDITRLGGWRAYLSRSDRMQAV